VDSVTGADGDWVQAPPQLTLQVGAVALPVLDTDEGPLIHAAEMRDLSPLASVINAAALGGLPGVAEAVAQRVGVHGRELSARPAGSDEDLGELSDRWAAFAGAPPGADAYVLSEDRWGRRALVPRAWLLAALEAFADRRPLWQREPAEPRWDDIEARAAAVDAAEASDPARAAAERRLLLSDLEAEGLLDAASAPAIDASRWPLLAAYAGAARELLMYAASSQRASLPGDEPPVSLDWFRLDGAPPRPGDDALAWLAWCEDVFRHAATGDAYAGVVYAREGDGWMALRWRRDDGVHAVLLSAGPRD
jgi:hypothetical protein